MGLSSILDTAQQALFAQQRAIQVTGNNIANVNTEGYSRERPLFVAQTASRSGVLRFGVSVDQVTRAFDQFITTQINTTTSSFHGAQTQADLFSQIESLFDDLSLEDAGLSGTLDHFFQAFQDLASRPHGTPERTIVQEQGEAAADVFNTINKGLQDFRQNLNVILQDEVVQVNRLATQIAELSPRIQQGEVDPRSNANTLRDERERLVKELAGKVNLSFFETNEGLLTVLIGGGRPLIEGPRANSLVVVANPNDPLQLSVQMQDPRGNRVDVSASIKGGKLHGLLELQNTGAPEFVNSLDRLAAQLISSVNQLHGTGFGLDGTTGNAFFAPRQVTGLAPAANTGGATLTSAQVFDPTQLTLDDYRLTFVSAGPPTFDIVNTTTGATLATGQAYASGASIRFDGIEVVITDNPGAPQVGDVFTLSTTQDAARDIVVDAGVRSDVTKIAAGQTPDRGDNTNALALAQLRDATLIDGTTPLEFYHTIVSRIGVQTQARVGAAARFELQLTQLENQRESLAGVSLDEEQINLIRFQQAFAAAAILIRTVDEMTDTVINLIR